MERQKNKSQMTKERKIYLTKVILLYFILIMGGVWYHLGLFSEISQIIAGYLIIFIGILSVYEVYHSVSINKKFSYLSVIAFIIIFSWIIELIGVKTGVIFGNYQYGNILQPQLFGTPIPIGFAWISTLLSSYAIAELIQKNQNKRIILLLFVAILMTFFDFLMEPAAIKLGYWSWQDSLVPIQNYVAWFVLGFLFALLFSTQKITLTKTKLLKHIYISQLIYFLIIYFK
ncbi:MAG: carotenoid biosynthesis protein [Candidatus Kapabacteria bacterium]|nr:carotenoid biosynthesis protein [Candidatus Kapabacteria bacterium]